MDNRSQKLVVAISQRIDTYSQREESRDAIDQRLVGWISDAGFIPITVPNRISNRTKDAYHASLQYLQGWIEAINPSAILLSGGNDIGEYPERDSTEGALLDWAENRALPVLGICRGLQMMAVRAGARMSKKEGHVRTRHTLIVSNDLDVQNWPTQVNSYHDWVLTSCPVGYKVMARVEDGSIEAIRHQQLPWEGWMWHPEREPEISSQDTSRLQELFGAKKQ